MITTDHIRADFKAWGARAWVDGRPVTLTELPTRTLSLLRGRSTCALAVRDLPPSSGKPAAVDILCNGVAGRFFTGITAERSAVAAAVERTANLVDVLDLDRAVPSTITWSSTSFVDAVAGLLEAAGIPAASIDSIFDPGATYELGPVYPIEVTPAENIGAVFRELMEFGGTSAYVTPSGRIRVVDSPGIPAASSATIYAEGANLDAGELGIFDAGWQIEGDEGAVAVFTATGPKRPDGAVPDGTFTATGIVGRPESRQYRLAQSDAVCQALAERELGRRARARTSAWFTAPLNPNLLPGDTVLLRVASIDLAGNTPAYVMEAVSDSRAGMRVVVSLGASLISGYATSIAPPETDFSMLVEHQLVTLAGVPVASYLVQCRDESRDRSGAEITARSWAASGPGASPTSSSEEQPVFLFTDLAGAEIALTATSATGEEATATRSPVAGELQVLSRVVSVACGGDGWRVLATTAGWRSWSLGGATCTAVPAFNEAGPLLSGWSSGAIYASSDALAAAPTLLAELDGSIGALHVNEGNPLDILAGHGSSLSRSQDGGLTWEEIGDDDFGTVVDVQSSPSNPGEIRVCAGDSLWLTYDAGASWVAVVEWGAAFDGSATAEALATAPWGHAAVFSDVGSALEGAVLFEEGYTVDWSGVDPAELPADGLTSITPMLEEEAFIVGETPDLIRDGALPALILAAGAGNLYKLAWSGSQFEASLLPPAVGSGAGKLIGLAAHYPIDDVSARSIGYGPLATPVSPIRVLLLTNGATPGGVWVQDAGGWLLRSGGGLPSGWSWQQLATNSATDWCVAGYDAGAGITRSGGVITSDGQPLVWRTQDAGLTWAGISLEDPAASGSLGLTPYYPQLGYTSDGNIFLWAGIDGRNAYLWRGTSSLSIVHQELDGGINQARDPGTAVAGLDGDVVVVLNRGSSSDGHGWGYIPAGASPGYTRVGTSPTGSPALARLTGGGRAIILGATTTWAVAADYRVDSLTAVALGVNADAVAGSLGGAYLATESGVAVAVDPLAGGAVTQAGDAITAVAALLADPTAAALSGTAAAVTVTFTRDGGATWAELDGPTGGDLQIYRIGVIGG